MAKFDKLFNKCPQCSGVGKVVSDELDRDIERIQDTQGLSYTDAKNQAVKRSHSDPFVVCPNCTGKGSVLTELGLEVREFIKDFK